ncbi:MAG: T9SS type A sorting domain-containing protein [Bacteroidota bacterium]
MKKTHFYLITLLLISAFTESFSATFYSRQTGNWSSSSTWSTSSCSGSSASVPTSTDSVVICSGKTVTVTANANIKSVNVTSGGVLQCGSGSNTVITVSGVFAVQNGGTYIHNTNSIASSTIFNGTESFGATSTIRIDKWSANSTSLIAGVSSSFGHVILNYGNGSYWNNTGLGSTKQILGNLTIGSSSLTFLDNSNSTLNIIISGKLYVYGELRVKDQGNGNTTLTVGDSLIVSGSNSYFAGMQDGDGNFTFNGQNVKLDNDGVIHCIHNGTGDLTFNFNNIYHLSSEFYGIYNTESANAGTAVFSGVNLNYSDNDFILHYGCNIDADTVKLTLTGYLDINFSSFADPAIDHFSISMMSSFSGVPNTAVVKVSVGGNMKIYGGPGDFFISSVAAGNEIYNIGGNLIISEGTNYFNCIPGQAINGHSLSITVNGVDSITGGTTSLSAIAGTLDANFNGAFFINNGTLSIKTNPGAATVNFNGPCTINGGTIYLYNDTVVSNDVVTLNAKSNFLQAGGIINFCNNTKPGGATNVLNLSGSTVTYNGGIMTRGLAGTGSVFGLINYKRVGTTNFVRSGIGGHDIQQVKQNVNASTLLDVTSGNIQVASHATAGTDYFTVSTGGTLALRNSSQLYSNAVAVNSGVSVLSGGRLKTQHFLGLYNGSSVAAINNAGNMNYYLDANSTVELYGTSTKQISGINVGLATLPQHKYGILEINHTGAANTTWVYPSQIPSASTAIYIRTQLKLTNGELNLINSQTPVTSGGATITIENSSLTSISRTNGYIKSEAQDFSGAIKWQTGSTNGNFVVPFGFSNIDYLPVTLIVNSGTPQDAVFATYHTGSDNQPWPPGINNLNSPYGLTPDNRDATVDRYWFITYSGTANTGSILTYANSEIAPSPFDATNIYQIHHYNTSSLLWDTPIPGQIQGSNNVSTWFVPSSGTYAIASSSSPLPITLLSFTASKKKETVLVEWSTASEINNDYFVVERSIDLTHVIEIGRIEGALNSHSTLSYSLIDKNPLRGNSYYRLRQVDIDGTTSYSKWANVKFDVPSSITLFPNPADNYIYVDTQGDNEILEMRIISITGSLITKLSTQSIYGFDISNLPQGNYFLQVIKPNEVINTAFNVIR